MAILFHTIDVPLPLERRKHETEAWIRAAVLEEGFRVGEINVVFCSDEYLLAMNRQYLQHDYLTDILTFDTSGRNASSSEASSFSSDAAASSGDHPEKLSGDLFISLDRVWDNAAKYAGGVFHVELLRVIIHGVLHLAGYEDAGEQDRRKMREREDHYLKKIIDAV